MLSTSLTTQPTVQKRASLKSACLGALCFGATMLSANVMSDSYYESFAFAGQTTVTSTEMAPTLMPNLPAIPSQNSINDVVSYYYGVDSTPILAEYKLCSDIGTVGAERNECVGELQTDSLVKGQTVYLWMNYLVPKGTQAELLLHYNHNGITRDASNLKVSGAIRYRTWKKIKLSRSGDWELPIYFEQGGEHTELDRITLNVKSQNFAGL